MVKCPNCGASLSPQTKKCEYCGTHLTFQNNVLSFTNTIECPECRTLLGEGSFICVKCGKILSSDSETISILKGQQKRIRFMQDRLRQSIVFDVVKQRLESKEMIYHVTGRKRGLIFGQDLQFVVTDKRIIVYVNGIFSDILYENIVTVSQPIRVTVPDYDIGERTIGYQVIITTYEGDRPFMFNDYSLASHFSDAVNLGFGNHALKRKDITALLCFADV